MESTTSQVEQAVADGQELLTSLVKELQDLFAWAAESDSAAKRSRLDAGSDVRAA